jgi:P-type Cu2+ transporter
MDHSHHHHGSQPALNNDPVPHTAHNQRHYIVEGQGHDKHAGHHTSDFLKRFWISLALTIPILFLSPMIQHWLGFHLTVPGDESLLLFFSALIYIYGGMPFLKGMVAEIRHHAMGMMTLVAVAITVAFAYSVAVIFGLEGMDFFWELATLIDIMLLGHWLEMRSEMAASRALESLVELLPSVVHLEVNGSISDVSLTELKSGDVFFVKPGEKIAADGFVLEGNSYINESMLTGESLPVKKQQNEKVIAGSLNGDGSLRIKATATGEDSYLNKMVGMVRTAQQAKSGTQHLADKVAKWLTVISIISGVATFLYWYLSNGSLAFATERLVTVMVTACPHALGVAIPLVVAISTTKAAVNGLLIRNRTAFEQARNLTMVIFDKTGTVTKGSHEVQDILSLSDNYTSDELLQYAATVQQHSEHYIGRGILTKLNEKKLPLWQSTGFEYWQGMGVGAIVNGRQVVAAGPNYFRSNKRVLPDVPAEIDQNSATVIYLLIDGILAGIITLSDAIRENATDAIASLTNMGIRSFLLTGDNERIAATVAGKLGMSGYVANVLPHEKLEKIREFQNHGEIVAMAGDGVNDAPALAQADVGIAMGSGTDVAADTADVILVNSDPSDVVYMIRFARATYQKMIENLFWAAGYNIIAIPLAAGILYPRFILSPALGAVLMSLSTVIVAINAQLLRRAQKH